MPDRRYVLAGLAVFLLAISYPAWRAVALGTRALQPVLEKARNRPCVLPPAEMRASHMKVLADWRDLAVRQGVRRVTTIYARTVTVSLTATCLGCHEKAKFCDRCHDYAGVKPECWSCHVAPLSPGAEARSVPGVGQGSSLAHPETRPAPAGLETGPTPAGGAS